MTSSAIKQKIEKYMDIFDQAEKLTFVDDQNDMNELSQKTLHEHFETESKTDPDLVDAVIQEYIRRKTTDKNSRTIFKLGKQKWILDLTLERAKQAKDQPNQAEVIDATFSDLLRTDDKKQIDWALNGLDILYPDVAVLDKYQELMAATDKPTAVEANKKRVPRYSYEAQQKIMERSKKIFEENIDDNPALLDKGLLLVATSMGSGSGHVGMDLFKVLPQKDAAKRLEAFKENDPEMTNPEFYTLVQAWGSKTNGDLPTRYQIWHPIVVKEFALNAKVAPIKKALELV